ncbi:MAG: damage-inducible protein DinB [Alphaproteobacteria bacterium]|nr:MAG: damage-inducible protein DinB [Alphaproteobacteria bacterium]
MGTMQHFALMARYNAWANARLHGCVADLPEADYRRDVGLFFGSVHATLNHILLVDRLWSRRIRGVDPGIHTLDQILCDDFASLRAAQRAEDENLIALVNGLDEARLATTVRHRRLVGGHEAEARIGHMLTTLFNHQTHHRGQVHAALTQAGLSPPGLDVIFFIDETGAGAAKS